jgi:hypothetical protein
LENSTLNFLFLPNDELLSESLIEFESEASSMVRKCLQQMMLRLRTKINIKVLSIAHLMYRGSTFLSNNADCVPTGMNWSIAAIQIHTFCFSRPERGSMSCIASNSFNVWIAVSDDDKFAFGLNPFVGNPPGAPHLA